MGGRAWDYYVLTKYGKHRKLAALQDKIAAAEAVEARLQLGITHRRLGKINVGKAHALHIDLTNLQSRKKFILAKQSLTSGDYSELKTIEKKMAKIKSQLGITRRRLGKINVGKAHALQIDLTNLQSRKKIILAKKNLTSGDYSELKTIEKKMAKIKSQLGITRRRLGKINVGKAHAL